MLFGLYLMFELFLLIGYFAYSYDHITGYTRVRKHPREMHPAEYLIGITIFTFLSIPDNTHPPLTPDNSGSWRIY